MNKREYIKKGKVNNLVNWLKKEIDLFKGGFNGCGHYYLDNDFEIAIGWLDGYDEDDEYAIHNSEQPSWCLNVGVKIANDFESDYEYMDMPWFSDTGDVWDTDITIRPDCDLKKLARELLETYVDIVNELNRKNTTMCLRR